MIPLDIEWLDYYGRFKFEVFLDSKNDLVLKARPVFGKRKRDNFFQITDEKKDAI